MNTKTCTHCGETKDLDRFPKYPKRNTYYPYCVDCKNLENRYCVLKGLNRNVKQQAALEDLEELFKARRGAGLIAPGIQEQRQHEQEEKLRKARKNLEAMRRP